MDEKMKPVYCARCGQEMTVKTVTETSRGNNTKFYVSRMVCKTCGWKGPVAISEISIEQAENYARNAARGTTRCFEMNGWRSTREILPSPDQAVLCLGADGKLFIANYDEEGHDWDDHEPDGVRYRELDVTYWMRIPDQPGQNIQQTIEFCKWTEAEKKLNATIATYADSGFNGLAILWQRLLPLKRRYENGERTKKLYYAMMEVE